MDLIERQAAIDALTELEEPAPTARHLSAIYDCEDAIKALPSAQPKKGKWINIRHDNIAECDHCGITGRAWMNFCFDCGADMREETK